METIEPESKHTHTIINLHGRDSNAKDYCEEFFESEDSTGQNLRAAFPTIKWVFPTAPQIESKRFSAVMSQWFDMYSTENPSERHEEQTDDLRRSAAMIAQLVHKEGEIVGLENVILCGISQGAATAITMMLMEPEMRVCAFVGFSTWLPELVKDCLCENDRPRVPVLLAHCEDDDVINVKYGEALRTRLEKLGMPVTWHRYADGGHWINEPRGVDDVRAFLKEILLGV